MFILFGGLVKIACVCLHAGRKSSLGRCGYITALETCSSLPCSQRSRKYFLDSMTANVSTDNFYASSTSMHTAPNWYRGVKIVRVLQRAEYYLSTECYTNYTLDYVTKAHISTGWSTACKSLMHTELSLIICQAKDISWKG